MRADDAKVLPQLGLGQAPQDLDDQGRHTTHPQRAVHALVLRNGRFQAGKPNLRPLLATLEGLVQGLGLCRAGA